MALTRVNKVGDGVTTVFNVNFTLGYISQDHVTAQVEGEVDGLGAPIYRTITFDTYDMFRLSGDAPGLGVVIHFERTVPKDALLVDFSNGDNLDELNLDTMQLQILHAVMEAIDGRIGPIASDFQMNGFRIRGIGAPVDDDDLATRAFVLGTSGEGGAGGAAGAEAGEAAAAAAIAALIVTQAMMAPNSVGDAQLIPGSVSTDELAVGAVDNGAIADSAVNARTINAADIAAMVTKLGLDTRLQPIGTIIDSIQQTAPAGYLKVNGTTIGSAASGATQRANADTLPLYTLLWGYSDAILPIQTSTGTLGTRGVSAASDFAANKRMPLWDIRGIFRRAFDDGRGKDSGRAVGTTQADGIRSHVHPHPHTHDITDSAHYGANGNSNRGWSSADSGGSSYTKTSDQPSATDTSANTGAAADTRPENTAFPVYIKY
jgi:hypothetical protein